jgi:hypothetical protein
MMDHIPLSPIWKSHAGGSVSPCAPKVYTMVTNSDGSATFTVSGTTVAGEYAGAEWYIARPIPQGASKFCLSYTITVSPSSLTEANAIETDCIATDSLGLNYNGSLELNYGSGGTIDVGSGSGGWAHTGVQPGKYTPNVPHKVEIFYSMDFINKRMSVLAMAIDGALYLIPVQYQNVAAVNEGWKDFTQVMVQVQLGLTPAAGSFSVTIGNDMKLIWS